MSGVYCKGCGEGNLLPDPAGQGTGPVICDLCCWVADIAGLPNISLEHGEPRTKRGRKAAGTLYFLWVHDDEGGRRAASGVMDLLEVTVLRSSPVSLVELDRKPSPDVLEKIAALKGVRKVWLVP
ncbi:MAG TPA: hypothetical protein VE981_02110 [Planctomycetota bacterium]|nr:hypothetical protein [Planctomycetota bacterium]